MATFNEIIASKDSNSLFQKFEIPMERVGALVELINECKENEVKIDKISVYQCGFLVEFGVPGEDAVCHESSYGHESGYWETIGFPWDNDDVSVHSAKELAKLLFGFFLYN